MSMLQEGRPEHRSRRRHHPLRIASWVVGILALAGAIAIVVLPLPKPAAGGTCGPGRGSEPAVVAFFDPVSIGAGPRPTSPPIAVFEWQAFVGQCQASTNARMVDALALVLLSAFFLLIASPLVGRAWRGHRMATAPGVPAGWYPDPSGAAPWRWWDGQRWSHETHSGGPPEAGAPGGSTQTGATGSPVPEVPTTSPSRSEERPPDQPSG